MLKNMESSFLYCCKNQYGCSSLGWWPLGFRVGVALERWLMPRFRWMQMWWFKLWRCDDTLFFYGKLLVYYNVMLIFSLPELEPWTSNSLIISSTSLTSWAIHPTRRYPWSYWGKIKRHYGKFLDEHPSVKLSWVNRKGNNVVHFLQGFKFACIDIAK
jgi:hypothetical protein